MPGCDARRWGRALATLLALLAGCAKKEGPEYAPVSGRVLRGGQPVMGVVVMFIPEDGHASIGITDGDGYFKVNDGLTQPGAEIGRHRVVLTFLEPDGPTEQYAHAPPWPPDHRAIVAKYGNSEKTPLRVDVVGGGIDVVLHAD